MTSDLQTLADVIDEWLAPATGIPAAYIFGSRVRGDHRSDSDVDMRLYLREWKVDAWTTRWWTQQNETDFASLKGKLPGPLALHADTKDDADQAILEGRKNPVLVVGKAVCVWTPPRRRFES